MLDWLAADLSVMVLVVLLLAAFAAGFVDSVVGGGGLIQLPVLMSVFPAGLPGTLLATNKLSSIFGTMAAAIQYVRAGRVVWPLAVTASLFAFAGSFVGAWLVTRVPPDRVRDVLPFVLAAVAIYTFVNKKLGGEHRPRRNGTSGRVVAAGTGGAIGFYDGFFGPGTGSFLVFAFVRIFRFDFIHASAAAKVVNFATNVAAILSFAFTVPIWFGLGLTMAFANVCGSILGTRIAMRRGSAFVRKLFLVVLVALILKTAWDAYR
jgi:uncharacterized protein